MNKTDREAADLQPGLRSVARPLLLLWLLMAFAGPAFAVGIKPESAGGALYGRASVEILYGRASVPALACDTRFPLGRAARSPFHSGVISILEHRRAVPALASGLLNEGAALVKNDSDWRRVGKSLSHREIAAFAFEELAYIVIIALIVFTGAGARGWELLSAKIRGVRTARMVYLSGVLILLGIIGLPFDLWRYHTDRVFGLSNQTLLEWLGDYAIVGVTGFVIALPALLGIYWLVKRKPRTWWRWTSAAAVPFIALAVLAGPYYAYLFNTFTPLQNKQLAVEVLALASKAGVKVDSVYQTNLSRQSRAANAYVAGLGSSKRLVLGDTLIQNFTDQEILFATAHEI
ncbi:MAG: M48 family metalloprotease, partial [Blastocatellia bacterium]